MNSLLIRISPAAGSLPTAITETTSTTGRGGGEKVMEKEKVMGGILNVWVTAKDSEICKKCGSYVKNDNAGGG